MQKIRIGTRESKLAIWQAEYVQKEIEKLGVTTELVFIKSDGEKDLVSPLYEMGVQGIFTKTLDIALLDWRIDIAVHSLKDVPTKLPADIMLASVPKRGNYGDILIHKGTLPEESLEYIIGTSSLRRRAQWLNRYPTHATEPLRGNIQARLEKLESNVHWSGAIFAAAAIERLDIPLNFSSPSFWIHSTSSGQAQWRIQEWWTEKNDEWYGFSGISLDWMLPAPAQWALWVTTLESNKEVIELCRHFNDADTELATYIERQFLRTLFGGCSMPIAAYARFDGDYCDFRGNILTTDGREKVEVELRVPCDEAMTLGERAAEKVIQNGGEAILKTFNRM